MKASLPLTFTSHNTGTTGTRLSMAFRKDSKKFTGRKFDVCISSSDSVTFCFHIPQCKARRRYGGHEIRGPSPAYAVVLYGAGVDGKEYRRSVNSCLVTSVTRLRTAIYSFLLFLLSLSTQYTKLTFLCNAVTTITF